MSPGRADPAGEAAAPREDPRRRRTRRLLVGALLVAAVLAILFALGWRYLRSAEPARTGEVRIAGLSAPVDIWRDSLGVPHIVAADELDLARALGYVHAQERLWQMELFRRVADGRLAEIMGAQALDSDRFLRTLGLGRAAAESEKILGPEEAAVLDAYAGGVNAWLAQRSGALPPEFLALRFAPEPWAPRHSIAISKIMAWDLADWNTGLEVQRATELVGPDLARLVHPGYPAWGPTVLGPSAEPRSRHGGTPPPGADLRPAAWLRIPEIPPLAARLLESASSSRASNSWVVGGARTRSGKPLVVNDPHLALNTPSIWFLAVLQGGRTHVAGVTIAGVPGVIIGRTPAVAWGFTNAMVDDTDFFSEEVHPTDSTRYRVHDRWEEFTVRVDTIRVRGGEPVIHRVRSSRNGPIISDVDRRVSRAVAMRWTGHLPSRSFRAFLRMSRAASAEELVEALGDFTEAHQNVVYADTSGSFGYVMTGRIPVRLSGDGVLPVVGSSGEGEWVGFLDFAEHPRLVQPDEGFIVTANNAAVPRDHPVHVGSYFAEPFRAQRIRDMLTEATELTLEQAARQQVDVLDLFALRHLGAARAAARSTGEDDAERLLAAWDGRATTDSRAAAIFYTWHERLRSRVRTELMGNERAFFPRYALNRLLDGDPNLPDAARRFAETRLASAAAEAMEWAAREVGGRSWGDLHSLEMPHALSSVGALERALSLTTGPFPSPGSPYTVNVAGFGAGPPFTTRSGASMRFVVDLGDMDGGAMVLPTGQSGLPFSPHFRDQTEHWREGRLLPVPLSAERARSRAAHHLRLAPATGR